MNFDPNNKPTGLRRLYLACANSARAFTWLAKNESAFKQELLLLVLTVIVLCQLGLSSLENVAIIISVLFIMFAEIVNTAIEMCIDRIGLEHHPLSGLAKDLGSAAVMLAIVVFTLVVSAVAYTNY